MQETGTKSRPSRFLRCVLRAQQGSLRLCETSLVSGLRQSARHQTWRHLLNRDLHAMSRMSDTSRSPPRSQRVSTVSGPCPRCKKRRALKELFDLCAICYDDDKEKFQAIEKRWCRFCGSRFAADNTELPESFMVCTALTCRDFLVMEHPPGGLLVKGIVPSSP